MNRLMPALGERARRWMLRLRRRSAGWTVLFFACAWGPALFVALLIFVLSSRSSFGAPNQLADLLLRWSPALFQRLNEFGVTPYLPELQSMAAHFLEYAALATTLFWGYSIQWPGRRGALPAAWLGALGYALSDEWHQGFVPRRHSDPRDIVADMLGAMAALALIRWVGHRRRVRSVRAGDNLNSAGQR